MTFEEFRAETIKLKSPKHFKVTNSYTLKEIWRWLKKNKWLDLQRPVTLLEFGTIIKTMHSLFVDRLCEGHTIKFPYGMGNLTLIKYYLDPSFKNGKLIVRYPVDWKKTLELWHEDKEARQAKMLVRKDWKIMIQAKIRYGWYNNFEFYKFTLNRGAKAKLAKSISNNTIDAFLRDEIC